MENVLQNGPLADIYRQLLGEEIRGRAIQGFFYSARFLPINASAATSTTVQIQADSDFIIAGVAGSSRDTGTFAAQTTFPFTWQIQDGGSGRFMFDAEQDWENTIGTAQRPAWWSTPWLVKRSSLLTVFLTNMIATARNVRISFWGVKVYTTNMGQ